MESNGYIFFNAMLVYRRVWYKTTNLTFQYVNPNYNPDPNPTQRTGWCITTLCVAVMAYLVRGLVKSSGEQNNHPTFYQIFQKSNNNRNILSNMSKKNKSIKQPNNQPNIHNIHLFQISNTITKHPCMVYLPTWKSTIHVGKYTVRPMDGMGKNHP